MTRVFRWRGGELANRVLVGKIAEGFVSNYADHSSVAFWLDGLSAQDRFLYIEERDVGDKKAVRLLNAKGIVFWTWDLNVSEVREL